eukprot:scaffold12308_cov71-Isochrysis_galbana.AAC.2
MPRANRPSYPRCSNPPARPQHRTSPRRRRRHSGHQSAPNRPRLETQALGEAPRPPDAAADEGPPPSADKRASPPLMWSSSPSPSTTPAPPKENAPPRLPLPAGHATPAGNECSAAARRPPATAAASPQSRMAPAFCCGPFCFRPGGPTT